MRIVFQYLVSSVFLICFVYDIDGQEKSIEKANNLYEKYAYVDAIESYKNIIIEGHGSLDVYKKLADCYYYISNYKEAKRWYDRMWDKRKELLDNKLDTITTTTSSNQSIDIDEAYYFRTLQTYKNQKKYTEADSIMTILKERKSNDSRITRFVENPDYLEGIKFQSGRYSYKNISLNSKGVDFAPSFYKNQVVFSSSRVSNYATKANDWDKEPYLDLYVFTDQDSLKNTFSKPFSKTVNSLFHESTSTFAKDGVTVYFTRNNLSKSKYIKDSVGVVRLQIYKAKFIAELGKWSEIESLSFNNKEYSVAHPTLNFDETKLYFASDMPGGYGSSDIYVVDIKSDGTFGVPKNLGPEINTEGRDTFPFISQSDMLYFASDGHLGLGGLDIFAVNINEEEQRIYNLGKPINSSADDFTYIIDETTNKGFFASNRSGGKGVDDIYKFEQLKPLLFDCKENLTVIVKDEKSGDIIEGVQIIIKNKEKEVIFEGLSNSEGSISPEVDCGDKEYEIHLSKKEYDSVVHKLLVSRYDPKLEEIVKMKNNAVDKGTDLAKLLNLKPIYFASNKSSILGDTAKELDKIVSFMKDHQTIQIEIGSHTDSQGSDKYNMKLSKRRATSTANYIISKGIDPARVKSRGYGETVLINRCDNGTKCSKDEHALNRRSEFIVLADE